MHDVILIWKLQEIRKSGQNDESKRGRAKIGKETGEQSKIYKYTSGSLRYSEKCIEEKKSTKGSCLYRLVLFPSLWNCHDHLCWERLLRQFHKVDRWYPVCCTSQMFDVSAEPVFHHHLMSEISGLTVEGRELVVRYQTDTRSHFFILLLVTVCMLNLPSKVLKPI